MRMKQIVMTGLLVLFVALGAEGAITVHSDFDFEDNLVPGVFSNAFGTGPTASGGELIFDGTTALSATTTSIYGGAAPTDNYGYEVIVTPSALDAFDILAGIVASDSSNAGSFLFTQGVYSLIEASEAPAAGTTAPAVGAKVPVAFVMDNGTARLFVNGVQEATRVFDATEATPIATLGTVTLGGNLFDGAIGAYDGSIDHARYFTFSTGQFSSSDLTVIPTPAALPAGLGLLALAALRRRLRA